MTTQYFDFKNSINKEVINMLGYQFQNGAVGIFPTDTVYGIGCNAFDETTINKLFRFKSRNYSKPICVLVSNLDMLDQLVTNVSKEEKKLIDAFWPGALTIIFNKKESISNTLTSNLNTIGIRMPNNQIALSLLNSANIPLATTSANISGNQAGIEIVDFYDTFNNKVDFIIDNGISDIKTASTIVQIVNRQPHILREGSISMKQIQDALNK